MAIDLGNPNTTRYHTVPDHADFTLPDSDWTWLALVARDGSSSVTNYIISTGDWGASNSINLYVYGDGVAGAGVKVSTFVETWVTTTSLSLTSWYWIYAVRRSGALKAGQIVLGAASTTESSSQAISGSQNVTSGPFAGFRASGLSRPWNGRWSQLAFISGTAITTTQAVELANGTKLLEMPFAANIKFLLHGSSSSHATLTDMVGGHVATRQGSSYGSNETDPLSPYVDEANEYTITPSGLLTLSGSSGFTRTRIFLPSGNISFSGANSLTKTKIISPSGDLALSGDVNLIKGRVLSPSGGLSFSGNTLSTKTKVIEPTGSLELSGTSSLSGAISYSITPIGNVTFSGTSKLIKTHIQIPTGGIVFSGTAPIESNTVVRAVSTRIPLTGAGN